MTSAPHRTRRLTAALSLLALGGTAAAAQTVPAPVTQTVQLPAPASAARTTDSLRVDLAPAQPRQGSVVRITVRPASQPAATVTPSPAPDSAARDTLPSVTIVLRPQLDSLRAVLDTMPMRHDSVRPDGVRADSTRPDSVGADSVPLAAASARDRDSLAIHATLFGEPLHFHRQASGEYIAIGGIPVDAPAAVRLAVRVARGGVPIDSAVVPLRIARTPYKMEKLAVAPQFGRAPDSALAARIAREQALAAAVSRRAHETPRLWEGEFKRPRATARVTSAFGDGREFNGAIQSRHMGLDLAGAVGAPVLATNRGVVALVGDFYYAGNAVYIDHGAGLVTAYFHLSAVDVAQGDTVAAGTRIGRVGATGRVTGPHLHWVARYGAVTIDPSTLLELEMPKPPAAPVTPPAKAPPLRSPEPGRQPGA